MAAPDFPPTILKPLAGQKLVDANGAPTTEMFEILDRLTDAVIYLQGFQAELAAVTKPSGGGTVDTQARTAIDAIIDSGT